MHPQNQLFPVLLTLLMGPGALAQETSLPQEGVWNAELAEHLLNRAAFGARPAEIDYAVRVGREEMVEQLLVGGLPRGEYFVENHLGDDLPEMRMLAMDLDEQARGEQRNAARKLDGRQASDFTRFWIDRMLSGEQPLAEKMTLFWHGHFASSQATVKNSYEMVRQNQLFYEHGLGGFGDLVRGIVRDPAMLKYLDNDKNRKGNPNENLAREVMELFTLGEGNYTEEDIKEAARALTGWSSRRGEFSMFKKRHDFGNKTIFGQTGDHDGDDLVDLLLAHPACGPFVAGKLINWFEGVEPDPDRAWSYGEFFASNGYDLTIFLRRLLNDPAFYRGEVIGNRIQGPIELLVSTSRRIGIHPPPHYLNAGSRVLGQRLLYPPSVEGWNPGEPWITTSTLMQRANMAGVLIGVVDPKSLLELDLGTEDGEMMDAMADYAMTDEAMTDDAMTDDAMTDEVVMDGPATEKVKRPKRKLGDLQALKGVSAMEWRPRMSLSSRMTLNKKRKDDSMIECLTSELLAVSISDNTRGYLVELLAQRREAFDVKDGHLLQDNQVAEHVLRDMAHVILSLPEAQLN